jgi:hypothetical protein
MTFKKVNPKEKVFHYIEIDPTTHVLFDSEFDIPIKRGSKNVVALEITNLKKDVVVHYYKLKQDQIQHYMKYGQKK